MEQVELLKQILEETDQLVTVCDLESHTLLYANGPARRHAGRGNQPYEGMVCHQYLMNRDVPCAICPVRELGDRDYLETEVNEQRHTIDFRVKRISWAGRAAAVLYGHDVTDLRRAERERHLAEINSLNNSLADYNDIINAVARNYEAIYYANLKTGRFVELGSRMPAARGVIGMSGYAREAFSRMSQQLVIPEQAEGIRAFTDVDTLGLRLRNRDWISRQYFSRRGIWLEGTFIVVDRDAKGDVENYLWCIRNIDEDKQKEIAYQKALEKAMQDAEAANEAKTAFLFNMSHDIRTPMNAILGYTELLKKQSHNPAKVADYLNKIHSSGEFLLSLINNVLEMARIESGKATLDEAPQSITKLQEEIGNVYQELMRSKKLSFICQCEAQTPYIFCDKVKVSQIFLNLVSNAYKYTPEGGAVSMLVKELPCDRPGYITLQTTIADTGIGMSREYQQVMFEEFSREYTATENKIQGTGLGLPIVKKLIDLMDGTVTVESEPGRGNCFVITLSHRIAGAPDTAQPAEAERTGAAMAGKRILLAEDNELNAEIAMEILQEEGFAVEHAADGVSCVDMLQKAPEHYYDLILMDIQMPNLDGYQATRLIREMASPRRDIPIVAMTANAFDEDRHNAAMAGMNDHLAKPIEVPRLLETLAKYLQ